MIYQSSAVPSVHSTLKNHKKKIRTYATKKRKMKIIRIEVAFKFNLLKVPTPWNLQSPKTQILGKQSNSSLHQTLRMKHDPFPILIHLGEREDYSGVSRGREIVLCC